MIADLPKPSAVIFDWDNTLVDTFPLIVKAHSHTRTMYGLEPFTIETASQYVHKSARDMYPTWFGENSDTAIAALYDFILKFHIEELVVLDGAEQALQHFHGDTPICIVSNKRGDILRTELKHLGWEKYIDVICGSGDAKKDKPDPTPAYESLNKIGIKANEHVWYVGDSESDFKVVRAGGFTPIYVSNRPMMTSEKLDEYNIQARFKNTQAFSESLNTYLNLATA